MGRLRHTCPRIAGALGVLAFGALVAVGVAWLAYAGHRTMPPWRRQGMMFDSWLDETGLCPRFRTPAPGGEIFVDASCGPGYGWTGVVSSWGAGVPRPVPDEWLRMFPRPEDITAKDAAGYRSPTCFVPSWAETPGPESDVRDLFTHAAGWPMLALKCAVEHRAFPGPPGTRTAYTWTVRWGVPVPGWLGPDSGLPLRPLPVGFAVDTIVFGAAGWGCIRGVRLITSWRRRRRGLCGNCGYDLHATPADSLCPECGHTASSS